MKLKIFIALMLIANNAFACEKVVRIIDGDTIETNKTGKVRILGIDAFDKMPIRVAKQSKRTGFSKNDVLHLNKMGIAFAMDMLNGKCITLQSDYKDTEIYGRKLRYVIVDGIDYSLSAIQQGIAMPYCEDKKIRNFQKYNEASYWECK